MALPVKAYNLTDPDTGAVVYTVPAQMVAQLNQQMQGSPGAGAWGTFGDALQIGAGIIELGDLRDLERDIRDSRRRLNDKRDKLRAYYRKLGAGEAPDFNKIADLEDGKDDAQDDLDRAQTRAIGTMHDNVLVGLVASGFRVVGRMNSGGGGGLANLLGGDGAGMSVGGAIVAGTTGALLYGALVDDDDRDRGGRRSRR